MIDVGFLCVSPRLKRLTTWPSHHLTLKIHPKSSRDSKTGCLPREEFPHPGHKYSKFKQSFHSRVYPNFPPPFPITSSPRPKAGTKTLSHPHPTPLQLNQLSQAPHSCRTLRTGSSGHLLFSTPTNMQKQVWGTTTCLVPGHFYPGTGSEGTARGADDLFPSILFVSLWGKYRNKKSLSLLEQSGKDDT